jgi:hypothetical protein
MVVDEVVGQPRPRARETSLDEGDGWVNWSGLATLLNDLSEIALQSVLRP